jgi:membrane-associated phospholipid phosphatase
MTGTAATAAQTAVELAGKRIEANIVSRLIWRSTAATLMASLAAAKLADVRFAHGLEFLVTCTLSVGALVGLRVYARCRGLGGERLSLFLDIVSGYILIAFALVIAQQAAGAHPVPDITASALRFDEAFGFRWFDYVRQVSSTPGLDTLLGTCYRNWIAEFVVAMAALAYVRNFRAIGEFTIGYLLTGGVTIVCFACFEMRWLHSAAAFTLPGFHHPSAGGPESLKALRLLRSGANTTLDFEHIEGFISLPSLHTSAALLLAAATRGLGVWRYPFLAFNVLVLVSTISEGGHDLVDVFAGIVLACVALGSSAAIYGAIMRSALPAPSAASAVTVAV